MILELGAGRRVDLTHRALVVGLLDGPGDLERVLAAGPDLVGLRGLDAPQLADAMAQVRSRCELPLAVEPLDGDGLRVALGQGAAVVHDPTGAAHRDDLAAVAGAGAVVVLHPGSTDLGSPAARRDHLRRCVEAAADAGLSAERVVVDDGLDRVDSTDGALELLRSAGALAELGLAMASSDAPVLFEPFGDDESGGAEAAHVLAISAGCRLLRVRDVRRARRCADVAAELLRHAGEAAGAAA